MREFINTKIKTLEEQYLDAVVALDKLCLGGLWTWDGYHRELSSPNSELLILSIPLPQTNESYPTSYQDELIIGIGCFWAILEEAHITVLGIHPDYQGQGFGQLLLTTLLDLARARNLERATLEVRQSNQVALSLYQKFDFKAAGKRKKYYQNPEEDAIVLWLGNLHQPEFEQKLTHWQHQLSQRLAKHWLLGELLDRCMICKINDAYSKSQQLIATKAKSTFHMKISNGVISNELAEVSLLVTDK